jgi:hypothetical protein
MATDFEAGGSWERVAAELRACRESQQRAWGDMDDATLGRYLAGELGGEERRQVEQALEALPELRKLTDLVRDVLVDCGPEVAPAGALTPAPRHARLWSWRPSASLVSLATAAGLLLALGLSLPRLGEGPAAPAGHSPDLGGGVAMRGDAPIFFTALRPKEPARSSQAPAREAGLARIEQMDRTVVALDRKGKRKEALTLARQYTEVAQKAQLEDHPRYAYSLNRVCQLYLEEGDLADAERSLQQALTVSQKTLGADHPATAWARNNLAGVYEVALNTTAPAPPPVRSVQPRASVFSQPMMEHAAVPPAPVPRAERTSLAAGAADVSSSHLRYQSSFLGAKDNRKTAERARATAQALHQRIVALDPQTVRTAVVPVLARAVRESPSAQQRQAAARALARLGPAACDAAPTLVSCLQKAPGGDEGRALAEALVEIGPSARDAVKELHFVARDGDARLEAWQRLQGREGRIGVNDAAACFSVRALHRSARDIRALAQRAEVELLVETARALRPDAELDAKGRLGEMGPRGVCVLVGKDDQAVRVWVTDGLRRQGLPAEDLEKRVTEHCSRQDFDGALAEAVRFVADFERAKK